MVLVLAGLDLHAEMIPEILDVAMHAKRYLQSYSMRTATGKECLGNLVMRNGWTGPERPIFIRCFPMFTYLSYVYLSYVIRDVPF